MGKITQDQRTVYQEKVKYYKSKIEELATEIKKINIEIAKNPESAPLKRIAIINKVMNQITIYCGMNEISIDLMAVKNTSFIEKGRQLLYEVIINIEKIVTNYVDVPFSDYSEGLSTLESMSDGEKLILVKKIGYCIFLVKSSFGENTKWKWSFVELEARFATITKNLFDLRKYQKMDDPRTEGFKERRNHLSIIREHLMSSSQGYREKYELSTKEIEDLKKAIDYQKALLRVNTLTGDNEKVENCKKQIEVWNTLLEKHLSDLEAKKRPQK